MGAFLPHLLFRPEKIRPPVFGIEKIKIDESLPTSLKKGKARDPFKDQLSKSRKKTSKTFFFPSIKLKGIIWDEKSPCAIIEYNKTTEVVKEGDEIEDGEIIKIEKDKIKIRYHGKEKEIFLQE